MKPVQNAAQTKLDARQKRPGLFGRLGLPGVLFVLGLLIGLAFFVSRELVWGQVLRSTIGRLPDSSWTWHDVGERGLSRITYQGFDLFLDTTRLSFQELTIGLATKQPVSLQAVTGPTLLANLGWDKTLRFSGGVDLAMLLPGQRVQGVVEGQGLVEWTNLDDPPVAGEIALRVPGLLIIPPGIMATNLRADAFLEGNQLTLASVRADGLIGLEAEGVVMLDWNSMGNSTYVLTGTVSGLGMSRPFSASGRLEGVFGK